MKTSTAVAAVAALLFSPAITSADVVLDWNAIMLTALNGQPPPFKNRFAANPPTWRYSKRSTLSRATTSHISARSPRRPVHPLKPRLLLLRIACSNIIFRTAP